MIDCWLDPSGSGEVKLYSDEPFGSWAIGLLIGDMCMCMCVNIYECIHIHTCMVTILLFWASCILIGDT